MLRSARVSTPLMAGLTLLAGAVLAAPQVSLERSSRELTLRAIGVRGVVPGTSTAVSPSAAQAAADAFIVAHALELQVTCIWVRSCSCRVSS